jgi:hypothetical protein
MSGAAPPPPPGGGPPPPFGGFGPSTSLPLSNSSSISKNLPSLFLTSMAFSFLFLLFLLFLFSAFDPAAPTARRIREAKSII